MAEKDRKLDEAMSEVDRILREKDDFLDEFGGSDEKNGGKTDLDTADGGSSNIGSGLAGEVESVDDNAADGKRPDRNSDLEEMSSEELRQEIQQDKKKATRSLVLAATALVAIIAICIAWFVANNIIKGGTSDVTAGTDSRFELASAGDRQIPEQKYYLNDDSNDPKLSAGQSAEFDEYYDIESHTWVSNHNSYYMGLSGIAWYQNGQTVVEPGANGTLEFYVIPKKSGLKSMTITLKTEAYRILGSGTGDSSDSDGAVVRARRSDDEVLQNMVDGHILLFRKLDDDNGYSGWIPPVEAAGEDSDDAGTYGNVFTITAKDAGLADGEFEVNKLYKITVYWVWPKYFRNYIYNSTSLNGDLFADISSANADYTALLEFVNKQKEMGISGGSKLFYSNDKTIKTVTDKKIDSDMADEVLKACDKYYNQADEYIGTQAGYMYISATVE